MKHLPSEILINIFIYLNQDDKLECLLVCSHWRQIIESSVLYHTLWLSCKNHVHTLMTKIQKEPEIAKRVEKVMLNFRSNDTEAINLSPFFSTLSNLRTLICYFTENSNVIIEDGLQFTFHNQIEHIVEHSCESVAHRLLLSAMCPNLTTLDINDSAQNTIPLLKNAPSLKNLTITDTNIRFNDIDLIHKSLPQLKSLRFMNLLLEDSTYDKNIIPAASITAFILGYINTPNPQTRTDLLIYIYKKYPNITELVYDSNSKGFTMDEINDINMNGWIPFFQNIGSQLKKLTINNGERVDNLFETMDKFSCQIEHLQLSNLQYSTFTKIVESQQVLYIQVLALKDIKFRSFDWLGELQVLKELKLSYWRYGMSLYVPINLNDIIDNAPVTLKSLFFHKISLIIVPKSTGLSNVESLTFRLVNLPEGLDNFISLHFPKLSKLALLDSKITERTLYLPTINMSSFCYTDVFQKGSDTILVVSLSKNERRIYDVNGFDCKRVTDNEYKAFHRNIYPSNKSWSANENTTFVHYFKLYCNSVKNIYFR